MKNREIDEAICELINYGLERGLITEDETDYTTNLLLKLFREDAFYLNLQDNETRNDVKQEKILQKEIDCCNLIPESDLQLSRILQKLLAIAIQREIIAENLTERDLFDTEIMNCLTPRPSQVIEKFWCLYEQGSQSKEKQENGACLRNVGEGVNETVVKRATEYFYRLCIDSNYIRRNRIVKDIRWNVDSPYGQMDISINLSKPEKDPKEIAAAKASPASGYPRCLLCKENVGYAGRINHPARQNLRMIPISINGEKWGFQYSPYVYYNEHCIVLDLQHRPMILTRDTFIKLFSFVKQFPHYFLGSNADLPIVGGSILSHDHYQGGAYEFPMARAGLERMFTVSGYEEVSVGIVKWPMSVIRLNSSNEKQLIDLADYILKKWRGYSDASVDIIAYSNEIPHNTITPIARMRDSRFELDLVLRNNRTSKEYPFGVFHPHEEYHHIKKENIGLIEVMGLAVLPSRLQKEIPDNKEEQEIWMEEVGNVFVHVLENAGVFKQDVNGREAFYRFMDNL